jgi:hypothetical protein
MGRCCRGANIHEPRWRFELTQGRNRLEFFADETRTGETRTDLRGLGRVTIACKCFADDGFEWLDQFHKDYLADHAELKSSLVLALMDSSRRARGVVLDRIASATVVVIDLAEHIRAQIAGLGEALGVPGNCSASTLNALRGMGIPEDLIQPLFRSSRRFAIIESAVPKIELLLDEVAAVRGRSSSTSDLFPNEDIEGLSADQFQQLLARFSLALGDALDPRIQAEALAQNLVNTRFMHNGPVSIINGYYDPALFLQTAVEPNRTFDRGSDPAFRMLEEANNIVVDTIRSVQIEAGQFSPGRLAQEDSAKVRGIQAADIAAGYARQLFEREDADTRASTMAIRRVFSRVMLTTPAQNS